jgi:hypothetical protein
MRVRTSRWSISRYTLASCVALGAAQSASAQVTVTNDRPAFVAALGVPLTLENFRSEASLPLGSTLNSATNFVTNVGPDIHPGDIQPGVTYSVAAGSLNINQGSEGNPFFGGFLSACRPNLGCRTDIVGTTDPLVVTFDQSVRGFGFIGSILYGAFDVTVQFAGGSFSQNFIPVGTQFFGFYRPTADITSVSIITDNPGRQSTFAIDDFTFPTVGVTAAPEPATLALLAGGLGLVGVFARRRRQG